MVLRSLEQERAKFAYNEILKVKTELLKDNDKKTYKSNVKKIPSLILNNGLGNALIFFKSKNEKTYNFVYDQINNWFNKIFKKNTDIIQWIMDENTSYSEVYQVTNEILTFLGWLKRFSETEIKDGE